MLMAGRPESRVRGVGRVACKGLGGGLLKGLRISGTPKH